jgi:alcohol dehydrogenase class IV
MSFEFISAGKIVFGCGKAAALPSLCRPLGRHFLVVSDTALDSTGLPGRICDALHSAGIKVTAFSRVSGEPTVDLVEEAVALARASGCDAMLGIGGGSSIDTTKAAAAMLRNKGDLVDYLEGVGKGLTLSNDPAPFVAVPTTAGTGAEVTKNAVIASHERKFKRSLRDERMLANVALVDPELTVTAPPTVTAYSGMDALTQLIESYVSRKSNPMTDALAESGIAHAARSLRRAYRDGGDLDARSGMAYASLLSGLCLANSGLGADHGIAAALGACAGVPHGLACAVLLPHVMAYNAPHIGGKLTVIARLLTGRCDIADSDAIRAVTDYLFELARDLNIPPDFRHLGLAGRGEELLAACSTSSMRGNPVDMSQQDTLDLINSLL